ncbi:MAG: hypothetical protein JSS66_03270 [Armatimonadetes bacterium]|nr:hypothetical protein [Armatimonadota bacterium]
MDIQSLPRPLDFGVIVRAFNLVKDNWQPFVTAGLFIFVAYGALTAVSYFCMLMMGFLGGDRPGLVLAILPFFFMIMAVALVMSSMIQAGLSNMGLKAVKGEPIQATDIFAPLRNPAPYLLASVLVAVAVMIGLLGCFVGAYIVAGLTMFVFPVMIDQKLAPMDALKTSVNMLKSQWLLATAFYFVVMLVGQLGAYACYIGLAFTMPVAYVAIAMAYEELKVVPVSDSSPISAWITIPSAPTATEESEKPSESSVPASPGEAPSEPEATPDDKA